MQLQVPVRAERVRLLQAQRQEPVPAAVRSAVEPADIQVAAQADRPVAEPAAEPAVEPAAVPVPDKAADMKLPAADNSAERDLDKTDKVPYTIQDRAA